MKLPRWLVILLLASSALAVLLAAGWWWTTWPERTAREFAAMIEDGDVAGARAIMVQTDAVLGMSGVGPSSFAPARLNFEPRGVSDVISGAVRFRVTGVPYQFVASRGTVTGTADGWSQDVSIGAAPTIAGSGWPPAPSTRTGAGWPPATANSWTPAATDTAAGTGSVEGNK